MVKAITILRAISFCVPLSASAAVSLNKPSLGLHQTGLEAKNIYESLNLPEEVEKTADAKPTTRTRTYKVGKNVICIKTTASSAKSKDSYFCSTGFNSSGESDISE